MNPENNRKKAKRYKIMGISSFILCIIVSLHWNNATNVPDLSIDSILFSLLLHIIFHPFEIFPINIQNLMVGIYCGLIIVALIYTEYLKKKNLRPEEENGSAAWNEDLKGFYKKYADVREFHLYIGKEKSFIRMITNVFLQPIENCLNKFMLKPKEKTGKWFEIEKD